jgi:hypothetical protein
MRGDQLFATSLDYASDACAAGLRLGHCLRLTRAVSQRGHEGPAPSRHDVGLFVGVKSWPEENRSKKSGSYVAALADGVSAN